MTNTGATPLRILVPLDGSDRTRSALEYAASFDAGSLTLLRVELDSTAIVPGTITIEDEPQLRTLRDELEQIAAPLRTDRREVHVLVRAGDPAREIIEAGHDVDLVVMTTRARGVAGRAIFGSVADQVSRQGGTPTLLIRGEQQVEALPVRILVPLDGSPIAETALPTAILLARACACGISLVRAVDVDDVRAAIRTQRGDGNGGTYEAAREQAERDAQAYLDERRREVDAAGIACETKILDGTPSFALLWEIAESDIVVMSSHGRSGYKRWLIGSVAEKLVRESKAPVVLVPGPELDAEE